MVDISAISGALSSLKALKDIAETMVALRDAKAFQTKRLEFQSRLIDAQNGILALQEERSSSLQRVSDLEKQVAALEAWEAEKKKYELKPLVLVGASFAYFIKPDAQGAEPFHCICAACYENRKKSILQFSRRVSVYSAEKLLKCPVCHTEVHAEQWPPPGRH